MVLLAKRAERVDVAGAKLVGAAAVGRAAHDLVVGADRIHDVEAQQRDVRRLEHVAAGVEHHVGQFGAVGGSLDGLCPSRISASSASCSRDSTPTSSPILRKWLTPALRRSRRSFCFAHREPRHRQQEARIDAVVAGLDAFAAGHAGLGPLSRIPPGHCRGAGCRARRIPRPLDRRRRARQVPRSGSPRSICRTWCRRRACRRRGRPALLQSLSFPWRRPERASPSRRAIRHRRSASRSAGWRRPRRARRSRARAG